MRRRHNKKSKPWIRVLTLDSINMEKPNVVINEVVSVEELPKVEIADKVTSTEGIKDLKMEVMHKIEDEFNEAKEKISKLEKDNDELKEELKNKGDQLCKMQSLNESLIKEVKNLKQENNSKGKLENYESKEELKKKDEEIKRLCKHNQELLNDVKKVKRHLQESESKNRDEDITTKIEEDTIKKLEEEICKKVEESLNIDEVKSEMQSRIEEGCKNLIDGITLQLQKEKEDKIQEGHQKILEEVELHLENVHVKYNGIISKARVIKDQAKRIEDVIVSGKKTDVMGVQNEGKPSHVKPYRHPHFQGSFQGRQED
jgi:chromosome segregation ATPase